MSRTSSAGVSRAGQRRNRSATVTRADIATIGRQAAVADLHGLKVRGAVAWWLWGAAHILFLVGGRNRSAVLLEWVWAYLTYRRGSRLITDRPTR